MPTENNASTSLTGMADTGVLDQESVAKTLGLLPMISVSIYCHGYIDQLIREAILPFWMHTKARLPQSYFWLIRYARGGQHLKLRLHVPDKDHRTCTACLRAAVETFFAELPTPLEIERDPAVHLPPIDPEDQADGLRPDRSLIWTRYRYLPELIGAEPLSGAAGFEAAFVCCLTASTAVILEELNTLGGAEIPIKKRMALALKLFLAAVAGVHPSAEIKVRYLTFQCEWLLRVSRDHEHVLAILDRKVAEHSAQQTTLGSLVTAASPQDGTLGTWCRAVEAFVRFCVNYFELRNLSELDGVSADLVYFAISRVVHNAMNPTAIGIFNEAYLCHLLRSALIRVPAGGPSGS